MILGEWSRLGAISFLFLAIGFAVIPSKVRASGEHPDSLLKKVMEAKLDQDSFNNEDVDHGVEPPKGLFRGKITEPTPNKIPGAEVINTGQLLRLMQSDPELAVIDVAVGPRDKQTVPYAVLWRYAGSFNKKDNDKNNMELRMRQIKWARPDRKVVFFSNTFKGKDFSWLAYNAAMRAVELGYNNIYWYRGGRDAWKAAGLPTLSLQAPHKRGLKGND